MLLAATLVAGGVGATVAGLLSIGPSANWLSGRQSAPAAYSPQDRRQSLIVLPFENSSNDPAQEAVAAALARELTELLARKPTAPLVPPVTAAAYRGRTLDLREVGRERDVHFALMGSARRQDGRLVGAVTLYQTGNARQIWSLQFDQPGGPEAMAGIAHQIAGNIDQATTDEEAARAQREHPDHLDKRDLMLAASTSSLTLQSKSSTLARIALIERALALDPDYVWALRQNGRKHADLVNRGYS